MLRHDIGAALSPALPGHLRSVGNNGAVPTSSDDRLPEAVVAYYRGVETTLLAHLRGRQVQGWGRHSEAGRFDGAAGHQPTAHHRTDHPVALHIADLEDLDEAIRSGITYFRLPGLTARGLVSLRVRPGEGSGIDTVATAALALATSMSKDGFAATAMTDGADGLYLIGFAVGPVQPSAGAARYASELAALAPEIATTDPADSDGRALVQPLPTAGEDTTPAPYSPGGPSRPTERRSPVDHGRGGSGQCRHAPGDRARRSAAAPVELRRSGGCAGRGDCAARVR